MDTPALSSFAACFSFEGKPPAEGYE